jgi:hypothetical protein
MLKNLPKYFLSLIAFFKSKSFIIHGGVQCTHNAMYLGGMEVGDSFSLKYKAISCYGNAILCIASKMNLCNPQILLAPEHTFRESNLEYIFKRILIFSNTFILLYIIYLFIIIY